MKFDEAFLTELSERNDIIDVVGSYVNLTKRTGSNYFGKCPFHDEKTPSFSVSPGKQIYHCFGCGKGGGVINFIMEIESMNFPEAVEFLAKRAGMALPAGNSEEDSRFRSRIYALNKEAAEFFNEQLTADPQKLAVSYLESRQITVSTAKKFGLGYAPDSWDSLLKAMKSKGFTENELTAAGLAKSGKSTTYDTFRKRLIFPVVDVRGIVIGFSGRAIGDAEPKYINSKETAVYSKGKNLFGMNIAKKSRSGYIILVEGNVDVVTLHQAGFDSAVASLGTSLTIEQARLISRYTHEAVIAYDSDNAGLKATQRAIDILGSLGVKVRVLRLGASKDPDEFIRTNGSAAFKKLIEQSESQIEYRLANLISKYDLSVPEQKIDYLKAASNLLASLPGEIERLVYSARVAKTAGLCSEIVAKEVELQRNKMMKIG